MAMNEIEKLIEKANPERIVEVSRRRDIKVTLFAIDKWGKRGRIPVEHWAVMMELTGVSLEKIYAMNIRSSREKKTDKRSRTPAVKT